MTAVPPAVAVAVAAGVIGAALVPWFAWSALHWDAGREAVESPAGRGGESDA